jgi:ribosomal protein S18 acetylase RimI-like enzyme
VDGTPEEGRWRAVDPHRRLQVVAGNSAAIALYESLGFVPASRYAYGEKPPKAG